MTRLEVYRTILAGVESRPNKRLIASFLARNGDRCAIGTLIPDSELDNHVNALRTALPGDWPVELGHTGYFFQVVKFNNAFEGTPEERYIAVRDYLRNEIAKMEEHEGDTLVAPSLTTESVTV